MTKRLAIIVKHVLFRLKHMSLFELLAAIIVFVVGALFLRAAIEGYEARSDPDRLLPLAFQERVDTFSSVYCLKDGTQFKLLSAHKLKSQCPNWDGLVLRVFPPEKAIDDARSDLKLDRHRFISLFAAKGREPNVVGVECNPSLRVSKPKRPICNLDYEAATRCGGSSKQLRKYVEAYNQELQRNGAIFSCKPS